MKDVKTRPKIRDVKLRDTALLAPRELSRVMKESAKATLIQERPKADDSGSTSGNLAVNGVVNSLESETHGAATYMAKQAYNGGKSLAQKRYESRFREGKSSNKAKQADYSEENGQPVSSKAAQEYRKEKAKQEQNKSREIKVKSEQVSARKEFSSPQNLKTRGETLKSGAQKFTDKTKRAYTQRAKAHAIGKMQKEMAKTTAKTTAGTAQKAARGISWIRRAAQRTAKAIIKALVGLLGGAGGLIALVLIIGGAAAVIATPFGVFWSGQDAGTMTMPTAVAQINAEYEATLSSIENGNPADSVEYQRIPEGGDYTGVSNWPEVVAVFACKTAGSDADAADVVTIDEDRVNLLTDVFWDMNIISYTVEEIEHAGTEDEEGWTERILHITIESKGYEEMMEKYHFSKSQKDALEEMMKPEYAQMLAELVGTPTGEMALTSEQIAALMQNLPEDLSEDRKAVLASAYSLVGKVSYFWGGKSYAVGWDERWGTLTKVTAAGSTTTGTTRPYGLDCSGFVDWAFYNGMGQAVGTGGGSYNQYEHCRRISFSEAIPGDIVFFSDLSHVGIYAGFDESGQPIVIHCGSSNGVSVTSLSIFSIIARPNILE
ncbi:MAG: NlpC/P60 family protein [Oscillospiraceae bacterium]|nr:NlpC/P60 family protein [Oscillospiraceae bacterium]